MSFIATQNKGFRINFENGFSISVQWGTGNYCEKRTYNTDTDPTKERYWESINAEIAVFEDGRMLPIGGDDQVIGWCSADEVAKYITIVQSTTAGNTEELEEKFKELKI